MDDHVLGGGHASGANEVRPQHGTCCNREKEGHDYCTKRDDAAGPGLRELDFEYVIHVLEIGAIEQKLAEGEERKQENVKNENGLNGKNGVETIVTASK